MPKHRSPGQKRKRIVRVATFVLFALATYGGALVFEGIKSNSLEWVNDHREVSATITELYAEEEEYRGRKGRKRYRDIYFVSYRFTADENEYDNTVEVSESSFAGYEEDGNINVFYSPDDPYSSDTESNIASDLSGNNLVGNMFGIATYSVPAFLVLYWLLMLVFVRESKKALPEGFYTETSWLDIDDNYVVALDGTDLVFFDIEAGQASDVQETFQNNGTLEELIAISKSSKFKRIPLSEIAKLTSDHNSDTLSIEHGDDVHSVEFLNQTVKAHALERIKVRLADTLEYERTEHSRLRSAAPSMIVVAIFAGAVSIFDVFILNLLMGIIAVIWVIPTIISRLIDPTVREVWLQADATQTEHVATQGGLPS